MTKENEGEGIVYGKGQLNKSRFARLRLCKQTRPLSAKSAKKHCEQLTYTNDNVN